jgi:hypothetical protein
MCSEGGARGNWTSGEVFDEINSLLNRLASDDLNSVPAESMGEDQIELQRICNRVQAEGLRRLRRFDSGQGYTPSGALTACAWLRWQLNLTASTASERVAISRKLAVLPTTEQAFADGDISYRHVALIVETASQLGEKFEAQAETILVDVSKEVCPWRLQRAIWNLKHCLDSDGVLSDANKANGRRYLHLSQTFDGVYRIDGWLDAEGGGGPQHGLGFDHGTLARGRRPERHAAPGRCRRGDGATAARRWAAPRGRGSEAAPGGQRRHVEPEQGAGFDGG